MTPPFETLSSAARRLAPGAAIVLGSGLGRIADRLAVVAECRFQDVSDLAATCVAGHAGRVLLGDWSGARVLVFSGRLHFYEGHAWERVTAAVRLSAALGVRQLILTNAAGGIRDDLTPGMLMLVRQHLDWTRPMGARLCPAGLYSAALADRLQRAARGAGTLLAEGTYAAVLGPNYETPAEVRALRSLGIDSVGMSVLREVEAGVAAGLDSAAINCITNRAAGLSPSPLSHEEVLLSSQRQADRLGAVLEQWCKNG